MMEFYWTAATPIYLYIVYDCLEMAELRRRDCLALKAKIIYYLAFEEMAFHTLPILDCHEGKGDDF